MPPQIPPLALANLLVGIALLLFGRRLFWVFVAGAGFTVGAVLATDLLGQRSDGTALVIAAIAGLLGALVAVYAQKVAIGLAGLLAGGYLGHALGPALEGSLPAWAVAVVGACLGAFLLAALFDWALIGLSSLLGAAVIAQSTALARPWPTVIFVLLVGVGLYIQARQRTRKRGKPEPNRS